MKTISNAEAKALSSRRGREPSYDWAELLAPTGLDENGEPAFRVLTQGEDFDCKVKSFVHQSRQNVGEGLTLKTITVRDESEGDEADDYAIGVAVSVQPAPQDEDESDEG